MIRRGTWLALGLFAVVLVGVYLWSRRPAGSGAPESSTPTPEALWPSIEIQSIRVEDHATGEIVEMQRDPDALWLVVLPEPGGPGDAARIEQAASWLASPRPRSILGAPGDLSVFGLLNPAVSVSVTEADGTSHSFEVGRKTPTGESYYLLVPGVDRIFLMGAFGLSDVIGLLDDVPLAPPTETPSPTVSGEGTPSPTP